MFKKIAIGAAAGIALSVMSLSANVASAATIKVMVAQEDWDKTSLRRNSRIQNAIMNVFNQTLNAPVYQNILRKYGVNGMDVYDETALTIRFYRQDRTRRRDEELITLARQIKMDVLTMYTIYAKAVKDPYTSVAKLQMALNYRALDVKSGRYLGGDNLDIDTSGVIFTGCAAGLDNQKPDAHCVTEFVADNAEKLARDAGNKLALQLAALVGKQYGGSRSGNYDPDAGKIIERGGDDRIAYENRGPRSRACANIPTTFNVNFIGFSQKQINYIEKNMAFWKCVIDTDVVKSSFSNITFEYKTRANQQRVIRNIRILMELMGLVADPVSKGSNEIQVEALTLREN